jgi:hypothetical protein
LAYTEDRTGSYRARLPVTEDWSTVEVPFENLNPYKWGWWNPFAAEFDPAGFETVGIQTKYKSEGPFELDIQKIEVV